MKQKKWNTINEILITGIKIDTSMPEAHTTSKKNVKNKYKYKYIQSVSYQNIE